MQCVALRNVLDHRRVCARVCIARVCAAVGGRLSWCRGAKTCGGSLCLSVSVCVCIFVRWSSQRSLPHTHTIALPLSVSFDLALALALVLARAIALAFNLNPACSRSLSHGTIARAAHDFKALQHTATHCNILQHTKHTATHCSTGRHTATRHTMLHHTAPRCTTLQHVDEHCNTPQHNAQHSNNIRVSHTVALSSLHSQKNTRTGARITQVVQGNGKGQDRRQRILQNRQMP